MISAAPLLKYLCRACSVLTRDELGAHFVGDPPRDCDVCGHFGYSYTFASSSDS